MMNKLFLLSDYFLKQAQKPLQMEENVQWKFEQVLFNNDLFLRDQAGNQSNKFIKLWTDILEKVEFYGDYKVYLNIPAGTYNVNITVDSNDPNQVKLESHLNQVLAPKMTNALKSAHGKEIPGTGAKMEPSSTPLKILLLGT